MGRSYPGRDHRYDLTIVGAGLAGSEAAIACARAGLDVLLVTTSLDTLYLLSGDREPLAPPTGTLMAELVPAVARDGRAPAWGLHRAAKYALEAQEGIHLLQSNVSGLVVEDGEVLGVKTWEGIDRRSRWTALCVGSFLAARLEQGRLREEAGRLGEMAYDDLFLDLEGHGFRFSRTVVEADPEGAPPYTVECRRFAEGEVATGSFELGRLGRLSAAGFCLRGYAPYERMATDGAELAAHLVALLARQP